jgi:hypothetical protein
MDVCLSTTAISWHASGGLERSWLRASSGTPLVRLKLSSGTLENASRTATGTWGERREAASELRADCGKGAAALDPLTHFGSTSDGMKIVMAFEKADSALRRMLSRQDVVRLDRGASTISGACECRLRYPRQ